MLFSPISGTTLLHRMDERLLFLSYLLYQLLIVSAPPLLLLALSLFTLVIPRLLDAPLLSLLAPLRRFLLLLLFFASVAPLSALISGEPFLPLVRANAMLLLRVLSLLLSAAVLLGVLAASGIARVMRWAAAPFGRPGRIFSLILVAFFAILPRLELLLAEQRDARLLRGPGVSGPLRRMRYTLYPLLREGVNEAEALTDAFLARGFLLQESEAPHRFRRCKGQITLPVILLAVLLFSLYSR